MDSMVGSMLEESFSQNTHLSLTLENLNADSTMKDNAIVRNTYFKNISIGGGYCNFMHPKHVSRDLKRQLFKQMYDEHPEYREHRRE